MKFLKANNKENFLNQTGKKYVVGADRGTIITKNHSRLITEAMQNRR